MKKSTLITLFTAAIFVFGSYQVGWGQTAFSATYTFTGTTGNVASFAYNGASYDGITPGTIVKVGVTTSSSSGNFRATNWPTGAISWSDVFTGTVDEGKYIGFTIDAVSGFKFTITSITFGIGRSASGTRQSEWRGSSDSYSGLLSDYTTLNAGLTNASGVLTNPDANSSWTGNVLNAGLNYVDITTSAGFRLYLFNSEATSGTAGLQGNITINGTYQAVGGSPMAATPTFLPAAGTYTSSQDVVLSCATPSSSIYYTTDGTNPNNTGNGTLYSGAIPVSATDTIKAIAYALGLDPSSVATAIYTLPTPIANIAALRASPTTGFYKLTGEAVLTYQSTAGKVKYIQDATGAIVIYDGNSIITSSYVVGDGIKDIYCTLSLYNGMLELIPYVNPGPAFIPVYNVTPAEITLASLTNNDQAKLVKIINTTITGTSGFVNGTNYPLTDPSGPGLMRTAYSDLNYIGSAIPLVAQDITGVVLVNTSYSATIPLLIPRSLSDFTNYIPATPVLFATPASKSGLNYVFGNGPSVSQSFDLTGSNLTGAPGNLTVDAGTSNYEVSSDNINFGNTASIPFSSATLTATPVYLRLKAGLAIGNYNGELIGVTGGGVVTAVNVTCSGTVLLPEPTNHADIFAGTSPNYSSIISTWSDNDGTQEATGFLILANTTGIFIDPIDGTDPPEDAALADGSGSVHILRGAETYTWSNLDASTPYFFKIYAYTNSGVDINFKTTPDVPSATISTQAYVSPIAAWTFDATSAAPNTPTSVAANYGSQSATAMLYADGTNGSSLWIADTTGKELNAFAGSTINDPRQGLASAGMSYCPLGGIAISSNGKSMILKFSMNGYENPILTYAARHSSTAGFNSHLWAYSTDGVNFTDFGSNLAPTSTTFTTKTLDLSTVNVLDQASTVYLKVTFNGATTSTSNNRLDNIVINATAAVPSTKTLNLTAYLESLFNSGTGKMNQAQKSGAPQFGDGIADQITVELHNNTAPFATAYTYSGIDLNTNGTVTISTIPAEVTGSFYVVLKHRNSVELWSATAVSFTGSTIDYNFSTSASQAYGNAMKDLGGVFGMFAGDVNQDGIVDSGDMVVVDNDAANFITGYFANDVNGDGNINAADLQLLNANATGFVGKKMP